MANWSRQKFDPTRRAVVALRPFTGGGRMLKRGDTFDWRALGMTERRAAQMFRSGYLGHEILDGDGGGDTAPPAKDGKVRFRATPGERITVNPPRPQRAAGR